MYLPPHFHKNCFYTLVDLFNCLCQICYPNIVPKNRLYTLNKYDWARKLNRSKRTPLRGNFQSFKGII